MKLTFKKLVRCFCIAVFCCALPFICIIILSAFHSLEAPYILLTNPQKLGNFLGTLKIRWNGNEKFCWVYSSKKRTDRDDIPCLLIYPVFRLNPFPFGHALKVTENSIGIFNDSPAECLPLGSKIYESSMTRPVYSVDDDMKGWDAKYEIRKTEKGIEYKVYPSIYSDRKIDFTVPFIFFEKLKQQ